MASPKRKTRISPRKQTTPIRVASLTSLDDFAKIARACDIVEASASGLLLLVKRDSLIPPVLRRNLNLDSLIGDRVFMRLQDMDLEISGIVARTQLLGKAGFLIAVDYSEEAPEYWRECLAELLPQPGEID
ncbi:MAG: hypothetical protein KF802_10320 [Bdellovibrionaceae bacterium]|nr:hypothetical protein [Pseudobdellovibrionaceae bacterium]MBX3033805.1 hypothetical protein [Pseudobdellovibrionaceae bacterium]